MNIKRHYIPINDRNRPGTKRPVKKIVIHYFGLPDCSAASARAYQYNISQGLFTTAAPVSSHYLVGLQGEIIACVPEDEISYCSNQMNGCCVSIECAHPDATGVFTDATTNAVAELTADICKRYGLNPETDVIRHYDVTGKMCPLYHVRHPAAWITLIVKIKEKMKPPVVYKVQIGAFGSKANAEKYLTQAKCRGFDGYVVKSGTIYRVQIGAFKDKTNATAYLTEAKKKGYNGYVVEV